MKKIITTATPQRISFAGGGTDINYFYEKHGGLVLSTTIDKFIYVTVKVHNKLFKEKYRLNYSITEHVDSLDDIKNEIARECIRYLGIDEPLYISSTSTYKENVTSCLINSNKLLAKRWLMFFLLPV